MNTKDVKLTVLATAICRTPAFSINDSLDNCWPALKELIRETSPEFFKIINDLELAELDPKARYTVWKYFNRARFRATPFGSFAAISMVPVKAGGLPTVIQSCMSKRNFISWDEKDRAMATGRPVMLQANATSYIFNKELRYLRYSNGRFELASTKNFPELQAVLNLCRQSATVAEACEHLGERFQLSHASSGTLLRQLSAAQILLTDRSPNITGPDYFERLNYEVHDGAAEYIIAERELCGGAVELCKVTALPGYLHFMNGFLAFPQHANLDTFKQAFKRKFDQKAIPLALALDPQTGIGYGDMAQNPQSEELDGLLENLRQQPQAYATAPDTPQGRFLLNALLKGETIRLESYNIPVMETKPALPNTLSVLFHYHKGQIVVEQAGGCTANSLAGRFTLGSPRFEDHGRAIAEMEEKANPGTMFFDVAYQAEKQVDNVNRRAALYHAELPLLAWSCHTSRLSLDDILVAVRSGEIVLWSKKFGKRIVPRIPSSYNYTRSDLALFRFLCDLQHQGLRTNLSFNLQYLFPGLDRYPRVTYQNIIVSPASWKIDELHVKDIGPLRDWLRLQQIDFSFQCGNSDQTLLFDPTSDDDLKAFILYAKQNKEFYITEALQDGMGIKDENGKTYAVQYIAGLGHSQQIYAECPPLQEALTGDAFLPGGEWLCLELYGHTSRSNQLLLTVIRPFLAMHSKQIKHWFFIRYNDGGQHIRLRIRLHDPATGPLLLRELKVSVEPLYNQGLLWDMQVKTYFRETERYGNERMELAEIFFAVDSTYTLKSIENGDGTGRLYHKTLVLMEKLLLVAYTSATARLGFIQTVASSYAKEFGFNADDYKKINRSFESLKKEFAPPAPGSQYLNAFRRVITTCSNEPAKVNLLADLLHMHVNRLFSTDQRFHEAILYQFLLKRAMAPRLAEAGAMAL